VQKRIHPTDSKYNLLTADTPTHFSSLTVWNDFGMFPAYFWYLQNQYFPAHADACSSSSSPRHNFFIRLFCIY